VVAERIDRLRVKLFADGADLPAIVEYANDPLIRGFTTNPTLMRAAGVDDYESFVHAVADAVGDRPVSFEVFADGFEEMERQALKLAALGDHVFVKVPVTDVDGETSMKLVRVLAEQGVQVNVTAMMTLDQVSWVAETLRGGPPAIASVFAGRIADSGRDPVPVMAAARELLQTAPNVELLWASPREVLNVVQADNIGCHIITLTRELMSKLDLLGRDLAQFSLETVRMFRDDAVRSGFHL
jgi:transaldolase